MLFLIPKSQRKAVFIANNAEDVLTQWIFILPPLFPLVRVQFFQGNTRAKPHLETLQCHKHCQTYTVVLSCSLYLNDWWLWNRKDISFFFLSLPGMHTVGSGHLGMFVDAKLKYIQTQNMHTTSKAARDICYRKDQRQHR